MKKIIFCVLFILSCVSLKESENLWDNEVGYSSFLMPDTNNLVTLGSMVAKQYLDGANKKYQAKYDEYSEKRNEISQK